MSDIAYLPHKINAIFNGLSQDNMKIAHAYATLLKLPVADPFRLANQGMLSAMCDHLALASRETNEVVQDAFQAWANAMR